MSLIITGKNTLRPQQLNINVATWVRLMKRDVPQQQNTPSAPPTVTPPSDPVPTAIVAPSPPEPSERRDVSGPALPPKHAKEHKPVAVPQPPPRIEEIQVGARASLPSVLLHPCPGRNVLRQWVCMSHISLVNPN